MKEAVYYCSPQGAVTRVSTVCKKPNGVQLTPDEKTLYLADWGAGFIYKYDVAAPGKLTNERKWLDLGANPDGLTLDQQGNLYAGCGGAGILVCSPEGRVDRRHQGWLRFESLLWRPRFQDPLLHLG